MHSQDVDSVSVDRGEVSLAGPQSRTSADSAEELAEEERGDGPPESSPQSPEEALRFEWWHQCAGQNCTERINTRWRFCQRCSRKKVWIESVEEWKRPTDKEWPLDHSFLCGCTSSSNLDVTAKDWSEPDLGCVACRGTGRVKDAHHYLRKMNRRRRLGAGPDDSIEAGSFEDTALEDTVTGASEHDFLSQDDWLIETDGPEIPRRPGEKIPRGRPKTGAEQPWAEVALLARLLAMDKPGKRLLGEQLALDVVINRGELAKQAGIPRPNLYRWARKVRQNDPKGGGAMSNTTEVPTIVERISALEVEFEQKKVEIAELARQVGLRFDDDDVQDAVQRLLDDVSNS